MNEKQKVSFNPSVYTDYTIYIKENTYNIDNSYFYTNQQTGKFYSVSNSALSIGTIYSEYFGMISFWQDSEITHYDVTVYSFLDMMSTIGGIYEIVVVSLSILFTYISQKAYMFYIIHQISQNESDLNKHYNQDLFVNANDQQMLSKNETPSNAKQTNHNQKIAYHRAAGTIFQGFIRPIKVEPASKEIQYTKKMKSTKIKTYHNVEYSKSLLLETI